MESVEKIIAFLTILFLNKFLGGKSTIIDEQNFSQPMR